MKTYVLRDVPKTEELAELKEWPDLMQKLLFFRGVRSKERADIFLNPNYDTHTHDPFLMKDMDKAVDRILQAIEGNERILIYSDYDADGIPAAVVLMDFFQAINYDNVEVYIPHRHTEGYGLHIEALETFPAKGVKLIITLDSGIVDLEEVDHVSKLGMDIIVTDHHEPGAVLPNAFAILNAKQKGCEYPYKMLCGAGVGFKLVQAILAKKRFDVPAGKEKWWLDMVGVATLSDMVPLDGENRIFAHYGLKVLRKSPRLGLVKLLSKIKVQQATMTEDDVGFMLTPRINAASRMGIPMDAFTLLSARDELVAGAMATHLEEINAERKGLVASLVKEVKNILSEKEIRSVIVIGNPEWRPALLGLVATNIVEEYNRPVFMWGREGGVEIKGSCRSDGSVDLVKLMNEANEAAGTFSQLGGHKMAGGFAISLEKIHHLEENLVVAYDKIKESTPVEEEYIDSILTLDEVNDRTYNIVEKLGPFGVGNPKPLFIIKNAKITGLKMFGKRPEHLELCFTNSKNKTIKAIAFFCNPSSFIVTPSIGKSIDLLATIEKSTFGGRVEIRLRIIDIL